MSTHFRSFADIEAHLAGLGLFHMDMHLHRMEKALTALDLHQPPFTVVQILGTNGKGSTAAFLDAIAREHGCRTGLYTSPHFVSPTERIKVNGLACPPETWLTPANAIMDVAPELTYFEFLTVLALLRFRDEHVDVALLEAGLGGRYDATTAVQAHVQCYTPIDLDHTDILGPTIEAIATDKAAAIRHAVPVCTAPQQPAALACLQQAAVEAGATLIPASPLLPAIGPKLGLMGPHQLINSGLALTVWKELAPLLGKDPHDCHTQKEALPHAFVPGRMQLVPALDQGPALVLDGAHNPHGMRALLTALAAAGLSPGAVIYSCLGDKDWQTAVGLLAALCTHRPVYIPQLHNMRAAAAADVAQAFTAQGCTQVHAFTADTALPQVLQAAARTAEDAGHGGPVVLCGSLYLLAEFFTLYPHLLTDPTIKA